MKAFKVVVEYSGLQTETEAKDIAVALEKNPPRGVLQATARVTEYTPEPMVEVNPVDDLSDPATTPPDGPKSIGEIMKEKLDKAVATPPGLAEKPE